MITLALPARRAFVRGFWLTLSILAAVPWIVLAFWTDKPGFVLAGFATAVLMGFVAPLREELVWRLYRAWNRRLVRPFAAVASAIVMRVCYFVVFIAAGSTGPRPFGALPGSTSSSWVPRRSLPRDSYIAPFAGDAAAAASGSWMADYLRWAWRTDNAWAVSLLPFLAALRLLGAEDEKAEQENIYTLF